MVRRIPYRIPSIALLVVAVVLAAVSPAAAASLAAAFVVGKDAAQVADRAVQLPAPVHLVNGSAWVPVRAVAEALGATVQWDGSTGAVTVAKGRVRLVFRVGSRTALVDGRQVSLSAPVHLIRGRTQVPIRLLGEGLGYGVTSSDSGVIAFLASDAAGSSPPTVRVFAHPQLGPILVDGAGQTLYLFLRDTQGTSACTGRCLENWPPLAAGGAPVAAPGVTGTLGVIARPEGSSQVTIGGLPLYTFARDQAPGDIRGHGLNQVWYAVAPSGAAIRTGVPAAPQRPPQAPVSPSPPASPEPPQSERPNPPPQPKTVSVDIRDFAFQPAELTVTVGDTVVWTNRDTAPHTVTSTTGGPLDSPTLGQGESFRFTFNEPGEYAYYCALHPNMRGTVIVRPR